MAQQDDPMVHTPHLDQAYELELAALSGALLQMADRAEQMVADAVCAVLSNDERCAAAVLAGDDALDAMETEIDRQCVRLIARRAPVGADLRLVTAGFKLVIDLERIGDLAVNVVKRAKMATPGVAMPAEVEALAQSALAELREACRALRQRDATLARSLRSHDKATDARNREAFDRLIRIGRDAPEQFEGLLALTNVCRQFERIGDHAVNVSEMVVFLVDGQVLRHHPGE